MVDTVCSSVATLLEVNTALQETGCSKKFTSRRVQNLLGLYSDAACLPRPSCAAAVFVLVARAMLQCLSVCLYLQDKDGMLVSIRDDLLLSSGGNNILTKATWLLRTAKRALNGYS